MGLADNSGLLGGQKRPLRYGRYAGRQPATIERDEPCPIGRIGIGMIAATMSAPHDEADGIEFCNGSAHRALGKVAKPRQPGM